MSRLLLPSLLGDMVPYASRLPEANVDRNGLGEAIATAGQGVRTARGEESEEK